MIGYGRFGKALAGLLEDAGTEVKAVDPSPDVAVDVRARTLPEALEGATHVVLAVPVPKMRAVLETLRPLLQPSQLVLDVGSVKTHPIEAMRDVLGADIPWIGTHPLFGPTSLALGERPLRVVLCPNPLHAKAAASARALFQSAGCTILEQDAEAHDRAMAETHALAFFVAKGMLDVVGSGALPVAPPSFQAIARTIESVRSDAGHLFTAIHRENPFAGESRRRLLDALEHIDRDLAHPSAAASAGVAVEPSLAIPDLGPSSPELKEVRDLIDEVDRELISLLSRRAHLAQRVGRAKARDGKAVRDPVREAQLLQVRRAWAEEHGLDAVSVEEVFVSILRFSRGVQKER